MDGDSSLQCSPKKRVQKSVAKSAKPHQQKKPIAKKKATARQPPSQQQPVPAAQPQPTLRMRTSTVANHIISAPLMVGSMCAGMLSEQWAISRDHVHTFAAETNAHARYFISKTACVLKMLGDVTKPFLHKTAPPCELLVAGFPCQPFSPNGDGMAMGDPRGLIIHEIVKYMTAHLPRIVLLENVAGLLELHLSTFVQIIEMISQIQDAHFGGRAYSTFYKIIDSRDHGLVQNRRRVYIVCIRRMGRERLAMNWPLAEPKPPLSSLFDLNSKRLKTYQDYPMEGLSKRIQKHLRDAIAKVSVYAEANCLTVENVPVIVDTDGAKLNYKIDGAPCLTKARGGSRTFWSLQHGRYLSITELMRLQGVPTDIPVTSERQIGMMLGNGFSVPVIRKLIDAALAAAESSSPVA